ncbi:hypothetical protein LZC95_25360 [Pendulispora brunnea]|uniref:Uncharacterized protein n=1 Tax=Pendulispora brunnea TaxID=2905690 RepID=A0ABZ2KPX5_9BACT
MKPPLRFALAAVVALLLGIVLPGRAEAQEASPEPSTAAALPARQANFAWDKTRLIASFSYRDAIDAPLTQKLSSGLPTIIAMRAYVMRQGEDTPVALAVQSCRVVFDLWEEVYRVTVTSRGGVRDQPVLNVEGVLRQCAEARDLPIADKSYLRAGTPHFLAVRVDINPVSKEMLDQMRTWVSRPTGSTGIGPSDALFGSFVGLFVRSIGSSDRTLRFRTQTVVP